MKPQVPAATRTLAILRTLAAASSPMTASAIARELNLPRSSTYHLLIAMSESGFVVHLPEEQRWGLGVAAFEVGAAYLRHDPLERLARPLLDTLIKEIAPISAVAHLGVLQGSETLYLLKALPKRNVPVLIEVGVRLPAALTASGRAMLSALPLAQVKAQLSQKSAFVDRTGRGPRTWNELQAELKIDQQRGYAIEDGFIAEEMSSIGVAVVDHLKHPVASIGLTYATDEVTKPQREALAQSARGCARLLSRRLGAA
ncbi:MAG: hypothetical protein RLZZ426_480 [Actinomycetota bacterium]